MTASSPGQGGHPAPSRGRPASGIYSPSPTLLSAPNRFRIRRPDAFPGRVGPATLQLSAGGRFSPPSAHLCSVNNRKQPAEGGERRRSPPPSMMEKLQRGRRRAQKTPAGVHVPASIVRRVLHLDPRRSGFINAAESLRGEGGRGLAAFSQSETGGQISHPHVVCLRTSVS